MVLPGCYLPVTSRISTILSSLYVLFISLRILHAMCKVQFKGS
jgi:hypothetical protein